ncbi:beta-glucosidase [Mucilaginibacter yixingensis]|uniref:Beta-glucosidase n=1 Tax=Mucilaginibacter yixingensis TaxID=1295612 RepID=A0A2T5JAK5_9SPHI|nr:glycoside hydrolase family 3 C-terminal domain-containing protein [Mucilaginibacter yixingensis]PTQ97897.1 beta-glucosidase [Mucilaginibacter yixingensis]
MFKALLHLRKVICAGALIWCGLITAGAQPKINAKPVPQLGKNSIKEVIAAMTLQEKALMVIGGGRTGTGIILGDGSMIGRTESRLPGAAGGTNAIPRLGIPAMVLPDGPAGLRIDVKRQGDNKLYYATAFPSATTLASTWDTALVKRVGAAFGNEVLEYGADIILAPGINIHRNPLGGRNFEYYSEDPVVAGNIAAAIIKGFQSNGIGTSIKHFVANNQEANRAGINELITERSLREIYLKAFEIAIKKSQPWTVMSSYNLVNGTHTSERADLLTTVLRDEWGFKGYVMTDWGGKAKNLIAQMNAGNDVIMPGNANQVNRIISAVEHDSLDVKVLDRNVEHILNIIVKSPSFKHYKYSGAPDLKAHAQVSRQAGAEGMVLLENHGNALPLKSSQKNIALLGNASYATIAGGTGSGDVNKVHVISLAGGLTNADFMPEAQLAATYNSYVSDWRKRSRELNIADYQLNTLAAKCDVAVLTIGRNSGETKDRDLDSNYHLKPAELSLIDRTATAFHQQGKKLIIVLNICGPIDTKAWRTKADAILLAWQPGQEAGDAMADVLTGKVNPSGKLATTFTENYEDVPSARDFPGTPAASPEQVAYREGIYVGYRYYDTFNIKPAYEFGYGLSYTTFKISPVKLAAALVKNRLTAQVTITNTGKVAGKEVVQVYVAAPAKSIAKPAQELKDFAKTRLLKPGESQTFTFNIPVASLASFHNDKNAWITDAGQYLLKIGTSSRQIAQTSIFNISATMVTERVHSVLHPPQSVDVYNAQ